MKLHTARCFHLTPVHAVLFTQHKTSLHCLTSFMEKISSFNERESKHFTSVSLSHSSKLVLIHQQQQTKPTRKTVKSWPTLYQSVPNPGVVNKNIPIFPSQIQEISWYVNQISSKSSVILYQHCVCSSY